jgi:hypothetical protein
MGLGAAANVASMPGATPRFTLSAGLRWGVLEADVSARAGIPVATGGTLTVAWWPVVGAEMLGCWVPTSGRLRFGICASALAEWWRLKGAGIAYPATGDVAFVALGGGFRVSVALGAGVELGLSFAVRVHALRPVATFDDVWFASSPASVEIGGFIRWSTEPTEFGSAGHSRPE